MLPSEQLPAGRSWKIAEYFATNGIRRRRNSCSWRFRIVYLPNTANYEKPRRLTWAQDILRMLFERQGEWLFSRLIVIFARGHAANAFAVWEFSQFRGVK